MKFAKAALFAAIFTVGLGFEYDPVYENYCLHSDCTLWKTDDCACVCDNAHHQSLCNPPQCFLEGRKDPICMKNDNDDSDGSDSKSVSSEKDSSEDSSDEHSSDSEEHSHSGHGHDDDSYDDDGDDGADYRRQRRVAQLVATVVFSLVFVCMSCVAYSLTKAAFCRLPSNNAAAQRPAVQRVRPRNANAYVELEPAV